MRFRKESPARERETEKGSFITAKVKKGRSSFRSCAALTRGRGAREGGELREISRVGEPRGEPGHPLGGGGENQGRRPPFRGEKENLLSGVHQQLRDLGESRIFHYQTKKCRFPLSRKEQIGKRREKLEPGKIIINRKPSEAEKRDNARSISQPCKRKSCFARLETKSNATGEALSFYREGGEEIARYPSAGGDARSLGFPKERTSLSSR